MSHHDLWLLLADSRRARLLRLETTAHGRPHVVEEDAVQLDFVESEHGRPSPLGGKTGHAWAGHAREGEEMQAQFARDVVAFLDRKLAQLPIPRLVVFAPARFLGALRAVLPRRLAERIEEHEGELTGLDPSELAAHRAVARLLRAPR